MRSGSDGWKRFSAVDRVQATVDALHLLSSPQLRVKVFAAVIEKSEVADMKAVIATAFEAVAVKFDNYLASIHQFKGQAQRGLVIFDKADFENNVQLLSHQFKHDGHANGRLRNFAEVPLFIDSRASRLIQMADMVAYWIFRRYESKDDRGFKLIEPYLHSYSGVKHGLCEIISQATKTALTNLLAPVHPFPAPSGLGVILPQAYPVVSRAATIALSTESA